MAEVGSESTWWYRRRFALLISLLTAAAAMGLSLTLPWMLGLRGWWIGSDVWWTVESARWMADGGATTVYQANPWYAALPGFLAVVGPVIRLGDALGLVDGAPFPLLRPSMWLLVGPVFSVLGATVVPAIDGLAESLGLTVLRRRALAVGVGLFAVVPTVVFAGHPEDLLALAGTAAALTLLRGGRYEQAAVLLSLAIFAQTWAGLLLLPLLALCPRGRRLRFLVLAAVPPAAVGLAYLLSDPHAAASILGQPMPNRGQRLPWWALAPRMTVRYDGERMSVVSGSAPRSVAILASCGAGAVVARWRNRLPDVVAAAAIPGGVLAVRVLCETEMWPYYAVPAAVMLGIAALSTRAPWRRLVGALSAVALAVSPPLSYIGRSMPPWPWFCFALGLASTGLIVAVLPARGQRADGGDDPVRPGLTPESQTWCPPSHFVPRVTAATEPP